MDSAADRQTSRLSQWKGLTSSQVALGCVNAVFLASRGVTGPIRDPVIRNETPCIAPLQVFA
jgi:hypothetical protein